MDVIVVTGASSGLGREFAEVLGNAGRADEVWVIARRTARLEELKNTINARVVTISLDLSSPSSVEKYRCMLADSNANVIALVNAAGFGRIEEFENITLSDHLDMIDVNVSALTAMTYVTIPYMKNGAEIYQIGSASSFAPLPYLGVYAATKSYVLSFSRSVNAELKSRGIHCMAVCPGWTRTEFLDRAVEHPDVLAHYGHFYTVQQVVRRAIRDMKRKKDVSVCGGGMRFLVGCMKILPHKLVLRLWCWIQKK